MNKKEDVSLKTFPKTADYSAFAFREKARNWKEGFEAKLREPKVSRKIMLWLANHENLPLKLKVEMVIGLYAKEILG